MPSDRPARPYRPKGAAVAVSSPTAPAHALRFPSYRTAFAWAFNVARTSGTRTRVRKLGEHWWAWRQPGQLTALGTKLAARQGESNPARD